MVKLKISIKNRKAPRENWALNSGAQWYSEFKYISNGRKIRKIETLYEIFGSEKVLAGLLLTPKNIEIQEIFGQLRAFQAIAKSLQDESTDLSDVRYMFDNFREKYPKLSEFMSQNA